MVGHCKLVSFEEKQTSDSSWNYIIGIWKENYSKLKYRFQMVKVLKNRMKSIILWNEQWFSYLNVPYNYYSFNINIFIIIKMKTDIPFLKNKKKLTTKAKPQSHLTATSKNNSNWGYKWELAKANWSLNSNLRAKMYVLYTFCSNIFLSF